MYIKVFDIPEGVNAAQNMGITLYQRTLVCLTVLCAFCSALSPKQPKHNAIKSKQDSNSSLIDAGRKLETWVNQQSDLPEQYKKEVEENEKQMQAREEKLRKRLSNIERRSDNLEKLRDLREQSGVDKVTYTTKSDFTCLFSQLYLSCSSGSTITVTSGLYGYFSIACASCCAPHPIDDCTIDMQTNDPTTWLSLTTACNDKTSCSFQYQGAGFTECSPYGNLTLAQYMGALYHCNPDPTNEVVAFTARSGTINFVLGEVVQFTSALTNMGGYFDTSSSTFRCPYYGLYMFSVDITALSSNEVDVAIYIDGAASICAWADNIAGVYSHGSNMMFRQCNEGQLVWVEALDTGYIYGGYYSSFSGLLVKVL